MRTIFRPLRLIAMLSILTILAGACGDDDEAAPEEPAADSEDSADDTSDEIGDDTSDSSADDPSDEMGDDPSGDSADDPSSEMGDDPSGEAGEIIRMDPIKFPVINMQDGLYAYPEVSENVQIMVDYYNSQGGIGGHPIEVDLCTAGDDPESAQACAQRFANEGAEFVYIASVINSAPVFEVLGPDGTNTPMLGHLLWDVPDSLQPGVYSTDPGLLPMAYEVIRYAVQDDGITNLAVLVDDSDIGEATVGVVDFFLDGLGGATSTPVKIGVGQADYLPALSAAEVGESDGLVLLIAESAACQPTRDALEALGKGDLPVYMGDWCIGEAFRAAGTAEGWRIVTGQSGAIAADPDAILLRQIYAEAGADEPFGLALANTMNMDFARQVLELAVEMADGALPTSEQIHAAAEQWAGEVMLGPDTISCPGKGAWVSTCNSSPRIVTLTDGEWVGLSDFNLVDVAIFDPLLG